MQTNLVLQTFPPPLQICQWMQVQQRKYNNGLRSSRPEHQQNSKRDHSTVIRRKYKNGLIMILEQYSNEQKNDTKKLKAIYQIEIQQTYLIFLKFNFFLCVFKFQHKFTIIFSESKSRKTDDDGHWSVVNFTQFSRPVLRGGRESRARLLWT